MFVFAFVHQYSHVSCEATTLGFVNITSNGHWDVIILVPPPNQTTTKSFKSVTSHLINRRDELDQYRKTSYL